MKDNLNKLLDIRNQTDTKADLFIYGEIVSEWYETLSSADQYPNKIKHFLDGLDGQELNIYINSVGGNVFAGIAIYNQLKRYTGRKVVHVDGVAASIASVIAMAGDEIVMPSNAMLMIHRASVGVYGNIADLQRYAEVLREIDDNILKTYADRLINPADIDEIKRLMDNETYLTAEETNAFFKGVTLTAPLAIAAKADNAKNHFALMREAEMIEILKLKGGNHNG